MDRREFLTALAGLVVIVPVAKSYVTAAECDKYLTTAEIRQAIRHLEANRDPRIYCATEKAPPGWSCCLAKGHEGPCAATYHGLNISFVQQNRHEAH